MSKIIEIDLMYFNTVDKVPAIYLIHNGENNQVDIELEHLKECCPHFLKKLSVSVYKYSDKDIDYEKLYNYRKN